MSSLTCGILKKKKMVAARVENEGESEGRKRIKISS